MPGQEIAESSIVRWKRDAVATEVKGEVVLMSLERDRCYGLGSTGSDIWRRLGEPVEVSELVSRLESEYESAPGQIQADVLRTLNELATEGLIEVCSERK
jgi:3-dehydroquinate dehydratase